MKNSWKRELRDALVLVLIVTVVLGIGASIAYLRYSQCRDDGYNATVCTSLMLGRTVVLEQR